MTAGPQSASGCMGSPRPRRRKTASPRTGRLRTRNPRTRAARRVTATTNRRCAVPISDRPRIRIPNLDPKLGPQTWILSLEILTVGGILNLRIPRSAHSPGPTLSGRCMRVRAGRRVRVLGASADETRQQQMQVRQQVQVRARVAVRQGPPLGREEVALERCDTVRPPRPALSAPSDMLGACGRARDCLS